jgi:MFS family permease
MPGPERRPPEQRGGSPSGADAGAGGDARAGEPAARGGETPGSAGRAGQAWARWPVVATRNSRLMLATRLTGQAADGLLSAALGSFVLFSPERQATAAQVAASFALLLLPYSLVGPFAGVLLDRWSRTRVLVVANLARAVVMLGVAWLVADDRDGLDLGATVLVAMGFGRLVLAGLSAALPHVVASRHLVTANALFPTAGTIASAIATVTGLILMPRLGPDAASHLVLIVAGALVLAALIANLIPRYDLGPDADDPARATRLTSDLLAVVEGMLAGIVHVHRRPLARRALGVVVAHRLAFGVLLVDVLLIVRNTLNEPAEADAALADFALAAGGASAGSLLAAVLTPTMAGRLGVMRWGGLTLVAAAVIAPISVATTAMPMLIVGSLLMGFAGQAVKIAGDTVLQRSIDDDYRGRVFSIYDVVLNIALVGGICLTAFTAPASGISPPLWVFAGLLLLATAAWSLRPAPASG